MKSCQQCESYVSIHHVRKQSNGTEICELCEIGQTNPFRVLEMVNDSSNSYNLPLKTIEDANRLSKQTNLSPDVIYDWVAKQLNNMPNNNGFDNAVKTEPVTLSDTEVCTNVICKISINSIGSSSSFEIFDEIEKI